MYLLNYLSNRHGCCNVRDGMKIVPRVASCLVLQEERQHVPFQYSQIPFGTSILVQFGINPHTAMKFSTKLLKGFHVFNKPGPAAGEVLCGAG